MRKLFSRRGESSPIDGTVVIQERRLTMMMEEDEIVYESKPL